MAVPDFQSFFKPLLDVALDGKEHSMKEAREIIARRMNIPEADLRELLPSGTFIQPQPLSFRHVPHPNPAGIH
jgi:restriction endonuclease Mrr